MRYDPRGMSKTRKKALTGPTAPDAPFQQGELKRWRTEEMAWTQEQAAGALGLKLRTYQNWEQSHRKMRFPKILRTQLAQIRAARKRAARSQSQDADMFD